MSFIDANNQQCSPGCSVEYGDRFTQIHIAFAKLVEVFQDGDATIEYSDGRQEAVKFVNLCKVEESSS